MRCSRYFSSTGKGAHESTDTATKQDGLLFRPGEMLDQNFLQWKMFRGGDTEGLCIYFLQEIKSAN